MAGSTSGSGGEDMKKYCVDMNEGSAKVIQTKQDIFTIFNRNRSSLKGMGVKKIGLFGSFVRGEQGSDSDIDLLVIFEPGRKNFDTFMELSFFLEDLLQRKIELVTVESLSPFIGPHILEEAEYADVAG